MTDVVLVFDEGAGIGLGHHHRCHTLADALRALSFSVELAALTDDDPETLVRLVKAREPRALVVDSYRVRADALAVTLPVIAIDDLERDLDVDLVIDPNPPNPGAIRTRAGRTLVGPAYALFMVERTATPSPLTATVTRVLVTFGASDRNGRAVRVANRIAAEHPAIELVAAIGPWAHAAPSAAARVEVVTSADGLGARLAVSHVVVTAGGVTMLEALGLGRPTVVVPTATNQHRAVDGVVAADAAVIVARDATDEDVVAAVSDLIVDGARRAAIAARGANYVDALGPTRAAEVIRELLV